jgi:pyruvate formate lyase activating enzyme
MKRTGKDSGEPAGKGRTPLILEIKGNSLDDGPGIRTVVFLKGCPLSCSWCHNPEAKSPAQEISFNPEECIDCEACLEVCKQSALEPNNPYYINREKCTLCFDCTEVCPAGALARVGQDLDIDEITAIVERDIPFFKTSGGGVTLSGGEPLMFMQYTSQLVRRLKSMGVHILIETSGYFAMENFEKMILPYVNTIYFDLKIFDNEEHKKQCGVDNHLILNNFEQLLAAWRRAPIEIIPRVPLIPGITATDKNLTQIAAFLKEAGAHEVALLQYNPLWMEKSRKIGQENRLALTKAMTSWMKGAELRHCQAVFSGFKIH